MEPLIVGGREIPAAELTWRFSRSSGPGGQGVNTTDSRVELSFDLAATTVLEPPIKQRALQRLAPRLVDGVLVVVAAEHRSQLQNRTAALARMSGLLTTATAPPAPPRRPTRPSRAAAERRLTAKRLRSRAKAARRRPAPD